jgi:fructose-specific PTS system IIB-like component
MTRIIAVTACPSGVAHTYMAAEALESAAKAKGWQVKLKRRARLA